MFLDHLEAVRAIEAGGDRQLAEGDEAEQLVAGVVGLGDELVEQPAAEAEAADLRREQEPPDPGRPLALLGECQAARDLPLVLDDPSPAAGGPAALDRGGQVAGDVGLEAAADPVLAGVDRPMHPDQSLDIARTQRAPDRHRTGPGSRRRLQHDPKCRAPVLSVQDKLILQ